MIKDQYHTINLLPIVMIGPSIGKKMDIAEITHWIIDEVGSIFHIIPFTPPLKPK